jgi:hypothetical protein
MTTTMPSGYNYGDPTLATSPVTLGDLDLLLQTLLWSDDDAAALRRAGGILAPQVEAILDVWYGFVGSHPHLVASFAGADGQPSADYLTAVRGRFARWIGDICTRDWDQTWLDHQHEIARRHHRSGKNQTDHVDSTSAEVPMRYLIAFVVPLTATIRSFLAAGASDDADLDAMHTAWFKAVTLTATLWTQPYTSSW